MNTIDMNSESSISTIVSVEKAARLQAVAEQLGGYSVRVVAEFGDPYTVFDKEQRVSHAFTVPEGKVLVDMVNARADDPTQLTNLSELWRAYDAEYPQE